MGTKNLTVKHFLSEPIEVEFSSPPARKKSPPCPAAFILHNQTYQIIQCISEWKEFGRRGRMAHNMQPQHAEAASQHGSWGVGRFYFEVETSTRQFFRIYYDRTPRDVFDRYGHWFLLAELTLEAD